MKWVHAIDHGRNETGHIRYQVIRSWDAQTTPDVNINVIVRAKLI